MKKVKVIIPAKDLLDLIERLVDRAEDDMDYYLGCERKEVVKAFYEELTGNIVDEDDEEDNEE